MKTNLAVIESDSVIASMTRASYALAEAVTVSQTKTIIDVARAAEIYAKRQHLSESAISQATSVKVEAMRKLGEILKATPKAKGVRAVGGDSRSGGSISAPPENSPPTLDELGLTKKESAIAQKLAGLSDEAFEQVREGSVTIAKALAAVKADKEKPAPVAPTPPPAPVVEPKEPSLADQVREETGAGDFDAAASEVQELRSGYLLVAEENQRLLDENAALKADGTTEEQDAAQALISELRETNRIQGLELDAVKVSRDIYLNENAQLKKQIKFYQRKLKELEA